MRLYIDTQHVVGAQVCGTWYDVERGSFVTGDVTLWRGTDGMSVEELERGHAEREAVLLHDAGPGFSFEEPDGTRVAGPFASLGAVRYG